MLSLSEKLQLAGWLAFFVFIIYNVIFRAPASDRIYSSGSEAELNAVRNHLEAHGIRTYVKSMSPFNRKKCGGLATPSLHILDPGDREIAMHLMLRMPKHNDAIPTRK